MKRIEVSTLVGALAVMAGVSVGAQTIEGQVVVDNNATTATYDFHFTNPPPSAPPTAQPFLLGGMSFQSGNLLPPSVLNAIQWTDPLLPPPDFSPPIYLYQLGPLQPLPIQQLMVGNHFGAVGVLDGLIDFGLPTPELFLPPIPQPPLGPGEQVHLPLPLPPDPTLPNPLLFQDDPLFPDGLSPLILVGLGLPGTQPHPSGMMVFGPADPLTEPPNPFLPGGNGEYVHVPAPAIPDPCIDDSLITQAVFDYLRAQETANGVHISSTTSVVNGVTVRDQIISHTEADDGFTYVTVVKDFVTTAFYRFPTGTPDPKGFIPLPGDLDGDGDVDGVDISGFFSNFTGPGGGPPVNPLADLDGDGDVDGVDISQAFAAFTGPIALATIPEPTSLALLGLGGLLIARRRRV